jgi:Na+-transporting NADH:ubiquinone oxidoreductase subunit C
MNTNSNLYTFIYASVLVIIVAAGLAFAAVQLKPLQDKNIRIEKMSNILTSANIENTAQDAEAKFKQYITNSYAVNTKGEKEEGVDAFTIDMVKVGKTISKIAELGDKPEAEKLKAELQLPVFECTKDGKMYLVLPLRGKGLWGPIWGYISLEEDFSTIYGASFDHKGETPGLGAEIATKEFQAQFVGKKIFEGENLVSITVHKGSAAALGDVNHGVDGISGGTITSKALEAMLKDCLNGYEAFLKSKTSNNE